MLDALHWRQQHLSPPPSTPDTRAFHLGAMVDPRYFPDELRTDNNTHPGYLLGLGHDADFVISAVKGPASVDFGQPLTAQVTVCNQGTRLDHSRVFLVLSQDENIRPPRPPGLPRIRSWVTRRCLRWLPASAPRCPSPPAASIRRP
ncbi:hypothetical protein ACN28S_06250 [Cystobacter fuscus]